MNEYTTHETTSPALEGVCDMLADLVVGLAAEGGGVIQNPPGSNCAEGFANHVFAIRDFCWCDGSVHPWVLDADGKENHPTCPPTFEHFASGITGEWYKRLGRDTLFSREPAPGEALAILMDCIASLGLGADAFVPSREQAKARFGWGRH